MSYLGYCPVCGNDSETEYCHRCGKETQPYRRVRDAYPEIDEVAQRKPLPLVKVTSTSHSAEDENVAAAGDSD